MTIPTKALAKQQQLVNSLLKALSKRIIGFSALLAKLKKQLNTVFNGAVKKVSVIYNSLKKKILSETLLEEATSSLTTMDVSIINKIGKVLYSCIVAIFKPFKINAKTIMALDETKAFLTITIYTLLWTYAAALINKLLNHFSLGEPNKRKFVSNLLSTIIVRPFLEMSLRFISHKQKNDASRDLYLKAITLVKIGNIIYEKHKMKNLRALKLDVALEKNKLKKLNGFKVGAANLALDVITNELQINYGNKPAIWLVGGLLSITGNLVHYSENFFEDLVSSYVTKPLSKVTVLNTPLRITYRLQPEVREIKKYLDEYSKYAQYKLVKSIEKIIPEKIKKDENLNSVLDKFTKNSSVKKPILKTNYFIDSFLRQKAKMKGWEDKDLNNIKIKLEKEAKEAVFEEIKRKLIAKASSSKVKRVLSSLHYNSKGENK